MSVQAQPASSLKPLAEDVRAHVARLLASGDFRASGRPAKLLGYLIEQTLAGRGDRTKAYDLAVSVLGRDAGFDPQGDPIVRVEIGRLRRRLEHYYLTDGRARLLDVLRRVEVGLARGETAHVLAGRQHGLGLGIDGERR